MKERVSTPALKAAGARFSLPAGWDEERAAELTRLWASGKTCSEIAKIMGQGLTRSAVIGKAHRLGLPGRPRPKQKVASPTPPKRRLIVSAGAVREVAADKALPPLRELADVSQARPWITRKYGQCAWPVGEPERPCDQLSCCAPTLDGEAYCQAHLVLRADRRVQKGTFKASANELMRALRRYVA